MRYAARWMRRAWSVHRAVFPRGRRRRLAAASTIERLEPRLALAITLPIQDASGLAAAGYDVWVTGHGIPGWQAAGAAPLYLMSLGSNGSFQQTATAIQEITSSGTTATVTTQAPHGLTSTDTVFIAGASVAGYDGSYQITVSGPTSFTYATASGLGTAIAQGTVYASALLASTAIQSAESASYNDKNNTGLAELTTTAPHGLSAGQTVEISGVTVNGSVSNGYNGVFSVAQTPTATTFQVTYAAPAALANGTGGTLGSVALEPVRLSQLPPAGITLDAGLTNISAKLLFFVAPATGGPNGLPFNGNGVTPTDPPTPPYGPSLLAPTSIFDIVEFAYLPWGATESGSVATITTTQPHGFSVNDTVTISGVVDPQANLISGYNQTVQVVSVPTSQSFTFTATAGGLANGGAGHVNGIPISGGFSTFDVSAVDGLAIPMTLTASQVKAGNVHSVGIRPESGFTRQAIGAAFVPFMTADPLGHVDPPNPNPAARDFSKLLYQSQVTGTSIPDVSASWLNNTATFTYSSSKPILQFQWVEISGFTAGASGFNGQYQVQTATSTSFTVTNIASPTSGSGGTVTPLLFQTPSPPDGQFASITAPKDWLGNQQPTASQVPPGLASQDPLATFWDKTIDNFFQNGNYLSIYLGKEYPPNAIYSGSSDGTQYTLSNGLNTYSFPKPTGGSLANALYVWSQTNAPSGDEGLLQDQIWQALCRGVALDGVSTTAITNAETTTAWNNTTNWYTQHASTAFPDFQSVYCPYSKFLHSSTLQGTVDTTGTTSIYLHNAAYGFGEDENPIGNPSYTGPLVPSKLDGTVYDDSTVTIRLAPWTATVTQPTIVSGDFNGDGLTDIASRDATSGLWQATLTPGNPADAPTTVPMTTWSTKFTYADIAVGDFEGDGKDDIIGRASNGVWWLLSDTGSGYTNRNIGRWKQDVAWVDVVVGNFDGDPQGQSDVAGRTPDGMWWMLHDNGTGFVNQQLARWSNGTALQPLTWSDIVVGNFDGAADGRDEIAGRNSKGAWWMLTYDAAWKNQLLGGWSTKQQWVDVLAGRFDASGRDTIAGRTAADAWWLLTYDSSQSAFTNVRMGAWSGSVDGWASVVRGDFDGNGFDDVAGRSLDSGSWTVTGLVSGSFQTKSFGGNWPTSSVWALAFAGLYDTASIGPPKKSGILGRSEAGTWVRSLSDGSSFSTAAVTGYP